MGGKTKASDASPRLDLRIDASVKQSIRCGELAAMLEHAMALVRRPVTLVDLLIVDHARMCEVHAQYLADASGTDVISFNLAEAEKPIEAQLILCADAAAREAQSRGIPLEHELLLYAIHGLLHCCGFDDESDDALREMRAEEDRILRATLAASRPLTGDQVRQRH
jgi:rRNA maturation RNase YbeY